MGKLWFGFVWRFLVFGMVSAAAFGAIAFVVPEAVVLVVLSSWLVLLGVSYVAFEQTIKENVQEVTQVLRHLTGELDEEVKIARLVNAGSEWPAAPSAASNYQGAVIGRRTQP